MSLQRPLGITATIITATTHPASNGLSRFVYDVLLIHCDTLPPKLAFATPTKSTDLAKRNIDALRIKGRSSGAPYQTRRNLHHTRRSPLNVTAPICCMMPDIYNARESDSLGDSFLGFEKQDIVSATGHDQNIEEKLFNMIPTDQLESDTDLLPQVQAPPPLRPHRSFPRSSDSSSPTISGSELLSLEGRPSPEVQMANTSTFVSPPPASAPAAPTLRRKGKFVSSTQNTPRDNRAQRISKTPSNDAINNGLQPPETSMSPSSYEWTQKFQQQISLQTHRPDLLDSQTRNFQDIQGESTKHSNGQISPRELFRHRKAYSEQSTLGSTYNHMIDYSQQVSHTAPRDMNVQTPILPTQTSNSYDSSPQRSQQPSSSNSAFRQHRQAQSWVHAPAGFTSDYAVSPSQIHPHNWLDGMPDESAAYFTNISYPTPTSQEAPAMYGQEELTPNCYAPAPLLSQQASFPSLPVDGALDLTNRRPQTPPPSNSSASPPTLEVTPSSHKQARVSRRQNVGSLRLRKSAAALKTAKSLSALKSKKSASHLHDKQSAGGSLNHQSSKSPIKKGSQQGMSFGFMNFTPEDRQKILTGVAPSGSSKTKARRELEASEERRRLSLAALKAVEVAGGDANELKQQLKVEVDDDASRVEA